MSGIVSALRIYPVKGLRGLDLDVAVVGRIGLEGDRRWMVVRPDGEFLTQRQVARMAMVDAVPRGDGLLLGLEGELLEVPRPGPSGEVLTVRVWQSELRAATAGAVVDEWLSERLGMGCRLVFMADERARRVEATHDGGDDHVSFADGFPLLATGTGSLAALNAALAADGAAVVPMDRFRANVVVDGLPAWSEDRWERVRIGEVRFRMPKPCERCVVVTRDQRSGEAPMPGQPLRTLGRLNRRAGGIVFGANLIPERGGVVRLGDAVEVEA